MKGVVDQMNQQAHAKTGKARRMARLSERLSSSLSSRLSGAGWVLLAPLALYSHGRMQDWLYNGSNSNPLSPQSYLLLLFYLLCAAVCWVQVVYLNPLLERHYPARLAPRMAIGLPLLLLGVVGVTIFTYFALFPLMMGRPVRPAGLYDVFVRATAVSLLVYGWLLTRQFNQQEQVRATRLRFETDSLAADLDRSELAILEAQIEPHFLFNTLAHVKRLYRKDEATAEHVLETLIAYLDRALPALRSPDWTVTDELGLIALYLELLVQRFGAGLQFTISVTPACSARLLPALTIATLVENAVRHGLAPKPGGGTVRIDVGNEIADGRPAAAPAMVITVRDDGVGLRHTSGNGLGLATVRARLRGRFGPTAVLRVEPQEAGGVCATIGIFEDMRDAA